MNPDSLVHEIHDEWFLSHSHILANPQLNILLKIWQTMRIISTQVAVVWSDKHTK